MKFQTKKIQDIQSDTLVYFVYEDIDVKCDMYDYLNKLSENQIEKQFKAGIISGKYLDSAKFAISDNLKVIFVGLGKINELSPKKFSAACATAGRIAKKTSKNQSVAIVLINKNDLISKKDIAIITISGLKIGLYEFDKYLSNKSPVVEAIELVENQPDSETEIGAKIGVYISHAMKFAKDLVNEQAQVATPGYIANVAKNIAKKNNLEIKVYDKNEIREINMNAFLAVSQGSVHEPKFIHLTYHPKSTPRKRIALVGKGITFDAGGMNIKPAASMLNMKDDMTGAASVLGIIQAIANLESDIELHVVSALCENMTSGSAYKQGDVLTAMNGKTIEVDNTDAEGRITLADALSYCDTLDVDEVIDLATLTGAVIVSLGTNITGVMGNNQEQIDKFLQIAKNSCENVWQMPILDELKDNLKSEIADMKNTGGRNAGTSTAAWFLSNFTKSKAWMHLDIAGTAYLDKSNKETLSGPSGVMIRSLINYLIS